LAGQTVLHVTHSPEQATDADIVLDVRAGQVVVRRSATVAARAMAGVQSMVREP
jgi:ABC-type transport system involved in cytochrome bd biosynthesis fused ATPase/permease subunit